MPNAVYRRIAYAPSLDLDAVSEAIPSGGWQSKTGTLARRPVARGVGYQLLLHANIWLTALENSIPVGRKQYRVLRIRRIWSGELRSERDALGSHYVLERRGSDPHLPPGFATDAGDDPESPEGHWADTPGDPVDANQANSTSRIAHEFVVGVGEPYALRSPVPGFGGIYFLVMIDRTPARYKVWMSLERRLGADEIRGAFGVPGFVAPPYVASPSVPNFGAFRYLASDWLNWREQLR